MANTYQQNDAFGASYGYVKYSVTPDLGEGVCPGETVTIQGTAYSSTGAIRCMCLRMIDIYGFNDTWEVGHTACSISKSKAGSFTISFVVPENVSFWRGNERGSEQVFFHFLGYTSFLGDAAADYEGAKCSLLTHNTDDESEDKWQTFTFLRYRLDPMIEGCAYTDGHALDPLGHFGSFVQNYSIPRMQFNTNLDPLAPGLTAAHVLSITAPGGEEEELKSVDGIFLPSPPVQPGAYSWSYTVTDSVGNSASESGSFEVLAYEPPRIDALSIQRYTKSVDDEGNPTYIPTDDGDRIWFTINAAVASVAGANAWTLNRIREDTSRQFTLLSGADGEQIVRVNDHTLDPDVYSPSDTVGITLILSDFFETVERYEVILKAGGYLHITKNGVAVGRRSSATPENKKFESAKDYNVYLYNGVQSFGDEEAKAKSRRSLGIEIGSGLIAITPSKANTPTVKTLTFPTPFSGAPVVMLTPQSTVPGTVVTGVGVSSVTAKKCSVYLTRTNTTKTYIYWFAYYSPEAVEDELED